MHRVALPLIALTLLAGCGTSDDRDQVRSTVQRFYDAVRNDRGDEACNLLSEPAAKQLESQTGQSCRGVITRPEYEGGSVTDVDVAVTHAKVTLDGGESAFLNRRSDGWRLTAVACKPEEGKPRDRPMDCEVDA